MRHHHLWTALTLVGTTLSGSSLWADTPVRPAQASFPSAPAASSIPPTQALTVSQAERLVNLSEKPVIIEKKVVVDYTVKAASIEVAWLQDAVTYPLHLRAENKAGEEVITLSGYVPSERLREKALFVARLTVGQLNLQDHLTVHPQMALPVDLPVEPNQSQIVEECIEKAVPGIGKSLQLAVDANGVTTVSGRVDEFSDRLKIIRALQGIPGCTAIRYDLRVSVPAPIQQASVPVVSINPVVPASKSVSAPTILAPAITPAKVESKTSVPPPSISLPTPPQLVANVVTLKQPVLVASPVKSKPVASGSVSGPTSAIVPASHIEPIQHPVGKVAASSLSGLFPPGMSGRTTEEPGIILGSPIIVRAGYQINLDVNAVPGSSSHDLSKSSTSSTPLTPATLPAVEPVPMQINVMPRLAK